jgi:hypothetical protein
MAVVMVDNLRQRHFSSIPESHPLSNATCMPMTVPASRYKGNAVMQSLLHFGNPGRKSLAGYKRAISKSNAGGEPCSKKAKVAEELPSAEHYILDLEQLSEHNYPLEAISDLWRKSPRGSTSPRSPLFVAWI